MRTAIRFLIVVAAMIAGGYLAAQLVGFCFTGRTGEWDPLIEILWIAIFPPSAIFSGMIATILTTPLSRKSGKGKRTRHPIVAQVFNSPC